MLELVEVFLTYPGMEISIMLALQSHLSVMTLYRLPVQSCMTSYFSCRECMICRASSLIWY